MRLQEKPQQEIVLGTAKEKMFGIDESSSIIFEILRDKMYSNKIGAVSREVASNSRDANRESKTDKNIEISFTNEDSIASLGIGDTSIIFKDYGVGISPDRMDNVFMKYAASTKRSSDTQTGGFGLGAKTPFAYTDSFVIKTVCDYATPIIEEQSYEYTDEEGVLQTSTRDVVVDYFPVRRLEFMYNAIIDSTGKGKMIQVLERETDKDCGTEIIIPILSLSDRNSFEREVYKATGHWTGVTYTNFRTGKPIIEYIVDEKDFKIAKSFYSDPSFVGLLDGIPYEIKPENSEAISGYTVYLNLDLSKLAINANRESLQYDEQTVKHVNETYESFKKQLEVIVKNWLSDNKSFFEAYEKSKAIRNNWGLSSEPKIVDVIRKLKANRFGSFDYDVLFKGEKVSKINLNHHNVVLAQWTGTASKYSNSSLSLNFPAVYLDKGGIRLAKNEKLDKFYLIKPDKTVSKEALLKERKYLEDLGITITNYSEVKPDKNYVKPVKSDKVVIYLRRFSNFWDKSELYFDKTLKTIVGLDPSKVAFKIVPDFRSHYTFNNPNFSNHKLTVIEYAKGIEKTYFVSEANYRNYLQPNGYKTVEEVYKTVELSQFDKYVESDRIRATLNKVNPIILEHFPELLPDSVIKFKASAIDEVPNELKDVDWTSLGLQPKKFNYKGVIKKYRSRMKINYPLLPAYLQFDEKDDIKVKNIENYIKLIKNK